MKKQTLIFLTVALSFLCSCAVLKNKTIKTLDIYGAGVIQNPVIVDLDVKEIKITGTASANSSESTLDFVKKEAVADALKKASADVLVEPKFETETSNGNFTASVTGFPATYKNFRSIKPEDVQLLQVGVTQKAEVYESANVQKKKSGVGAVIGVIGGMLGSVLIVALLLGI